MNMAKVVDATDLTDEQWAQQAPLLFQPEVRLPRGTSRRCTSMPVCASCTSASGGPIAASLVGDEGATEYLVGIPDGKVTRLQLGPPYTSGITGHESWIGDTKEILVSIRAEGEYTPEKGNLLGVRAGAPPRVVSQGYRFSHVGTSTCGRFFSCDDGPTADVVIGSIRTGKNVVVCHSESSFGSEQNTHPHPYLSPDLKWVVFNSDRSGEPQVHAAMVPPEMFEDLEKTS